MLEFPGGYIGRVNIQQLCKEHGVGEKIALLLKNTAPWGSFNPCATESKYIEKPLRIQPMKLVWRERLLKGHGVDNFDKVAHRQLIEELATNGTLPSVGPTTIEAPPMDDMLVFDLETASSEENPGVFDVMHTILSNSDAELPHDMLETNGKLIKFIWGDLCFLDLCFSTISSLKSACKAYAIETQKTELPHRYLQKRFNRCDILTALVLLHTYLPLTPARFVDFL